MSTLGTTGQRTDTPLLPPLPVPMQRGDMAEVLEMTHELTDIVRKQAVEMQMVTTQLRVLTTGIDTIKESISQMGLMLGIRSGSSIGVAMGLTPSEKGMITNGAWKYVYAGSLKLVWMTLNRSEEDTAYPISMETGLDIVETIRSEVPTEVRVAISAAATPFSGDLPSIYLAPSSCLQIISDIPLALTSFNSLIAKVTGTMYVCLPREMSTPFMWYRGVYRDRPD